MRQLVRASRIISISTLLLVPISSFAGPSGSGGGDIYSQEFVTTGYDILQRLSASPIAGVDVSKLAQAVANVTVNSQDSLMLNGHAVDAINYPDEVPPHIEMSRAAWDRMKTQPEEHTFLVLHEYLGILKIDDTHYQVSHQIDQAKICTRTPDVRIALESFFHVSCDRILISDLLKVRNLDITINSHIQTLLIDDLRFLFKLETLRIFSDSCDWSSKKCPSFEVPSGIFNDQQSLFYLSLNGLKGVASNQFAGASKLRQLILNMGPLYNDTTPDLGDIQSDALSGISPDFVILGGRLNAIQPGAFRGLNTPKLTFWRWKDAALPITDPFFPSDYSPACQGTVSQLKELPDGAFEGLQSQKKLDLSCFKIDQIGDNVWQDVPNLQELELSSPSFGGVIGKHVLQHLSALKKLGIYGAVHPGPAPEMIVKIEDNAFDGLTITDLSIEVNLNSTNPAVFYPLKSLSRFQILAADLEVLPSNFFSQFTVLNDLYLGHWDTQTGFDRFGLKALGFKINDHGYGGQFGEWARYLKH
jgi:hypothetical protein